MSNYQQSNSKIIFFDNSGKSSNISPEELASSTQKDGVVWIHLNLEDVDTIKALQADQTFSKWLAEIQNDKNSIPSVLVQENDLYITLMLGGVSSDMDIVTWKYIKLIVSQNKILSIYPNNYEFSDALITKMSSYISTNHVNIILIVLLNDVQEKLNYQLFQIQKQLDALEELVITQKTQQTTLQDFAKVDKSLSIAKQFLSPQQTALHDLSQTILPWVTDDVKALAQKQSTQILQFIQNVELMREHIRINQDLMTQYNNQQSQKNMYILSMVGAIFLPLTFITGLFGMNVGGIPLSTSINGLLIMSGVLGIFGILLLVIFKKIGWL